MEAMNAEPAQGSRVARKAVPLEVAGAGAGEPCELQQAMVMMARSVSAVVQCQAEVNAGAGLSAATDGKLPGMRYLMGGSKRLKEVGMEHFTQERTLKRARRPVMMPVHLHLADKYNQCMYNNKYGHLYR